MSFRASGANLVEAAVDAVARLRPPRSRPILIVGHGRSGTSWLGSLLGAAKGVLYYSEPSLDPRLDHRGHVANFQSFTAPGAPLGPAEQRVVHAFAGRVVRDRTQWHKHPATAVRRLVDAPRVVVKEVATVLSTARLIEAADPVTVGIIRHPCAVAASERRGHVDAGLEKEILLANRGLWAEELGEYRSVLHSANSDLEIYTAVWGLKNLALERALEATDASMMVSYENLAGDPAGGFAQVMSFVGLDLDGGAMQALTDSISGEAGGRYSTTRDPSRHIDSWRAELTASEIDSIRRVVGRFPLEIDV